MNKVILLITLLCTLTVNAEHDFISKWTFDKPSGNTVEDSGSNNLTAQLKNKDKKLLYTPGMFGNALKLNGSNNQIIVSDPNHLLNLDAPFTISAWIKPEKNKQMCILSKKYDSANSGYDLRLNWLRLDFSWGNGRKTHKLLALSHKLKKGKWQHLAVTNDGKTVTLYLNAVPILSKTYDNSRPIPNTSKTVIGNYTGKPNVYSYDGSLDELCILNQFLTEDQILKLAGQQSVTN